MKIRSLIKSILASLGLSTLLTISYPITANAQYDPRPILEYATGRVELWIGNQLYNPHFYQKKRIPIGTRINTEGNSRVVFTYYWPAVIDLPDGNLKRYATCAKQVFLRNRGPYPSGSYTVERNDTLGRCDVTDENGLIRAQQSSMQNISFVSITYYASSVDEYDSGRGDVDEYDSGKGDIVYSASQQVVSSQRRRQNFWNWWWK